MSDHLESRATGLAGFSHWRFLSFALQFTKKNFALTFVRTITQLSNPSAQLYIFYCPTAHLTKVVLVLSPASKGHVGGNHKVCMTKQGTDADTLALHGVYQLQESRVQNGNQNSMLIPVDLLAFKANLGFSTKG